jgi:hypothetical protein
MFLRLTEGRCFESYHEKCKNQPLQRPEEKAVKTVWDGKVNLCSFGTVLILYLYLNYLGARGSVVVWGTMLQAGRSPVRVPDKVDFFKLPNHSSRTMALGSTQQLTKMSTRNLSGSKKLPARRADNLAAICEPNIWKCGSLKLSQP